MTSPCRCAGEPKRAGHAPTRYRDLGPDGRAVEVSDRRQRLACRSCGATWSVDPAPLEAPFRITRRLADRIFEACLDHGFAGAAETLGIDERTARDVFGALNASRHAEMDEAMPDVFLLRGLDVGRHGLVAAYDLEAAILNVFEGPFDARLTAVLGRDVGGAVHTEARLAAAVRSRVAPGTALVIHRASAQETLLRLSARGFARTLAELSREERRVAAGVAPILGKPPAHVSAAEARTLAAAMAASAAVERFARARERLARSFDTPCLGEATDAYRSWGSSIHTRARAAFLAAMDWMDEWGDHVLNEGYGAVRLASWQVAGVAPAPSLPRDTPARTMARMAAAARDRRVLAPGPRAPFRAA